MADTKLGMSLDAIIAQSSKSDRQPKKVNSDRPRGGVKARGGQRDRTPAAGSDSRPTAVIGNKKFVLVGSRKNLVKVNVPAMQQAQMQTADGTSNRNRKKRGGGGGGTQLQAVPQQEQQFRIPVQRGGVQKRSGAQEQSFRAPIMVQQFARPRQLADRSAGEFRGAGRNGGAVYQDLDDMAYEQQEQSKREVLDNNAFWQHDMHRAEPDYPVRRQAPTPSVPQGVRLLISNLDFNVSEDDLLELFATCGSVVSHKLNYDKSGRSLGTAEVVFSRRDEAQSAKQQYNNIALDGKLMRIEIAGSPGSNADVITLASGIRITKQPVGSNANGPNTGNFAAPLNPARQAAPPPGRPVAQGRRTAAVVVWAGMLLQARGGAAVWASRSCLVPVGRGCPGLASEVSGTAWCAAAVPHDHAVTALSPSHRDARGAARGGGNRLRSTVQSHSNLDQDEAMGDA
ncbi:MAG: hypothetical protein WDW36_003656 [Sanguina aurantia]